MRHMKDLLRKLCQELNIVPLIIKVVGAQINYAETNISRLGRFQICQIWQRKMPVGNML